MRAEFGLWILQEGTLEHEANLEEHGSHVRQEKVGQGMGGWGLRLLAQTNFASFICLRGHSLFIDINAKLEHAFMNLHATGFLKCLLN